MNWYRLLNWPVILVVTLLYAMGCSSYYYEDDEKTYRIQTSENTTIADAAHLAEQADVEEFTVRATYSGHDAQVFVQDRHDLDSVIQSEVDRLKFLSRKFNAEDELEAPVRLELLTDAYMTDQNWTFNVRWIEYHGRPIEGSELVSEERQEDSDLPIDDTYASLEQALVTDYEQDAWWAPAGGTSTIYASGTLQKFWLDSSAQSAVDETESGLEIDTVIKGASNASCFRDGVSSNMPAYYADTEFLDDSEYRNCSVGTIAASELQTWTLYWTWHPFASFNEGANPFIAVMYQVKDWCPWVTNLAACWANRAWCMCDVGFGQGKNPYPTQWLIGYDYYDRPGEETSWTKD